jgi:hypothetical protein
MGASSEEMIDLVGFSPSGGVLASQFRKHRLLTVAGNPRIPFVDGE